MDALMQIAAAAAPDHGGLGPLRLVAFPPETRSTLAAAFARAALESDPDATAEVVTQAKNRAMAGETLVAVIARILEDHAITAHEQWISGGVGLQNVLLAAASLGFGAKMVSGARLRMQTMRSAFALGPTEHLVGFIALGTPTEVPRPARRRPASEVLSVWAGSSGNGSV
jgi:nitroreductase